MDNSNNLSNMNTIQCCYMKPNNFNNIKSRYIAHYNIIQTFIDSNKCLTHSDITTLFELIRSLKEIATKPLSPTCLTVVNPTLRVFIA